MNNLFKTTALAAAIAAALPLCASAGDAGKPYFAITGEYIFSGKSEGDANINSTNYKQSYDFSDGLGVIAAVGYHVNDNIRVEAEGAYRNLNADTYSFENITLDASEVEAEIFSAMANAYYTIPTGTPFSPYVGAGFGLAHAKEGGNTYAYQGMVGVDYKVSDNGTLFTGYRYFKTGDFSDSVNISGFGTITEKLDIQSHAIDVGYRFSF